MEIPAIVGQHYALLLPVGLVIVCVILVFAFGFKSSAEPPGFKQSGLSADDKKSVRKKKLKDKKSQSNGHATSVLDESDHKKDQKTPKQSNKNDSGKGKRPEERGKLKDKNQKSPPKQDKKPVKKPGKENVEVKPAKSGKKKEEKPTDYDEGKWETAISRKDKKNKKKDEEVVAQANNGKGKENKAKDKKKEPEKKQASEVQSPKSAKSPKTPKSPKSAENKDAKNKNEKQVEAVVTPVAKGGKDNQGANKNMKKKSGTEKGNENVPVTKENAGGKQSKTSAPAKKPASPKTVNKKESEPLKEKNKAPEPQTGAGRDEAEEAWKEAPQKKGKKKARKD